MNNAIKITVDSPLIRPGIKWETEVSEKYLVEATLTLLNKARELNVTPYPTNNDRA